MTNSKDSSPESSRTKRKKSLSPKHEEKHRKRHRRDKSPSYKRYYGEDLDKKKRNSDRYWNKYAKDDKPPVVGSRYYDVENKDEKKDEIAPMPRERKKVDMLTSKTGGAYIPPAKLRMMQAEITDKNSTAYQRIAWEALKKSIHGYINKVNTSNIAIIAKELLHENIVRGRGLLCKSIIQAQAASPTFTNVYAALVAIINTKFPNIGELLLKRLVLQFRRSFKQNNKAICISSTTFIAHLTNQGIAHEILALEILTLLVETPTDDSVEVAISFLKECGQKLTEVSSKGINAIFEMLRNILHEGQLERRIQYMIEVMFQIRKDGFKDHVAVTEELDLVDEEDQFPHIITLDEVKQGEGEDILNVFQFDDKYEENEGKYKLLIKEILDDDTDNESGSDSDDEEDEEDEDEEKEDENKTQGIIIDNTDSNLISLRRTIYLTMQSSLDFEECTHKLLKMQLKPGQEIELCHMILDCCAEQRTYEKFFGLVAQRFCQINKVYIEPFQQIFKDTYATTHRLDANRLRNVSKFFAHLLFTYAIGWEVLEIIKLNEEDTNSSSRIFIKILFQELAEYMGLGKLNKQLKDESLQAYFAGLFPRDHPKNTRFSINFFTSIGLGGLTDELREYLKTAPKVPQIILPDNLESSSSDSSSSDSDSSSSSSSSEEEKKIKDNKKKKNKRNESDSSESSDENNYHRKKRVDKYEQQFKKNVGKEKKGIDEISRRKRNAREEERREDRRRHEKDRGDRKRDERVRKDDREKRNHDRYTKKRSFVTDVIYIVKMGISRDHWHKRRATGGKRKPLRKKRKFELGRPAAQTKLGSRRIRYVRTRGGNLKYRALRLDTGNFAWGSEGCARKTRIIDVVYNASNNELVRTKTLVKNAIVVIDATPFRQYYESHYMLPLGRKKGAKLTPEEEAVFNKKMSKKIEHKYELRKKMAKVEPAIEEQFTTGRLLACLASRPGQCGRADGYVLEGKELEFYIKKIKSKKSK
ncbi:pre-mRNA-splicing factor CWC22 homolog [Coccinella septempunctata]|uniref:pre-mRNA-splicing factor CWC22 homolog n=1 Tax=Coccinella septempunctata TaxID=41139 RepID=UPI001D069161|nr:pre-mRNA-splicing factor CWC22 homolog [Coccinella septempunctata]